MFLTYKYKLKLTKRSRRQLAEHARSVNQVWNYCVETQKIRQKQWKYGQNVGWLSRYDLQHLTSGVSCALFLNSQTVQTTCRYFVEGRDRHKKCPKFRASFGPKRKMGWVPFESLSRQITANSITYLKNTYRFFGAKRQPLPIKETKGGCFVEDAKGDWYVCFCVEVKKDDNHGQMAVGIDLGLKHLAVLSNGQKFENPKAFSKWQQKLGVAQRANNKKRAKAIHIKIKNIRSDNLHKLTADLIKNYETLYVGNVKLSSVGLKAVRKSAQDASHALLRTMLRYKASRHGAKYVEVDEKYTTQTCSQCGQRPEGRPKGIAGLGIREWKCNSCGAHHDRDVNAAINILAFGLSTEPPVEESRQHIGRIGTV